MNVHKLLALISDTSTRDRATPIICQQKLGELRICYYKLSSHMAMPLSKSFGLALHFTRILFAYTGF